MMTLVPNALMIQTSIQKKMKKLTGKKAQWSL